MSRLSLLVMLFLLTLPAFAKPYPTSCNDLWNAVAETLGNPGYYQIIAVDDVQMKASFVVVGARFPGTHFVSLKAKEHGCELQTKMAFTGNDEDYVFRKRINHAFAKRNASKPPTPTPAPSAPSGPTVGFQ